MNRAELVKALRLATQAGMADCVKALDECNNDLEAAQKWLREKGIAKANKKLSATAYEGIVKADVISNKALIIEVNSQTDFTAKNDQFIGLVNTIFNGLINTYGKTGLIDIENTKINDVPLQDMGIDLSATTGEKIAFRRGEMLADNTNTIAHYNHSNNRIATIVILEGKVDKDIAKDVAMHVAALAPKYIDETNVDSKWLASEREVLANQFKEELLLIIDEKAKNEKSKRESFIVDGKVKKMLKEICLVDQYFIKDDSKTVGQYMKEKNTKILYMIRYELGEGIEKKVQNFADEVAAQIKK